MVLLNGVEQAMGRYPNSDRPNGGYLYYETHYGKTSITDNEANYTTNWAGAELVMRPRRWILDRNKVTSTSGTKIYYSTSSTSEPYDKYGYFFQNSIKTLDKFGEWYYNPSTKKISMFFGSNSPNNYTVEASAIDNIISSDTYSDVTLSNLTIEGANASGIYIKGGSNIKVQNCDILFSGVDGVLLYTHTNFKLENCTVSNQNNNGVNLRSGTGATIRNCKILNTALLPGMITSGNGKGNAISSQMDGNTIEYNEIRNTGFIGISFTRNNVTIKNNFIDRFCLIKDDGGGIYSNNGSNLYTGSKVIGNIITNGIGAGYGTPYPSSLPASGIYFDNTVSMPIEVTGNTIANCSNNGMYNHNVGRVTFRNNTLYNNSRQLRMIESADYSGTVKNNVITQNIFFSRLKTQETSNIESSLDNINNFGRFDSNYYARPIDDKITIYTQYPGVISKFDLAGWKNEYNKDASSKITAKQIAAYRINSIIGSNKFTNGTFTSSISGIFGSSATVAFSTSGGLDGGCVQVTPTAVNSVVSLKMSAITAGKKYIVRFSIRGSVDNNMVATVFLKRVSPYAVITQQEFRKVGTTRTENEIMFLATTSETPQLVLATDQKSKYYLDNIKIFEADATMTNIDDSLRFEFNATKVNKTVTLNGNYIDTKGNKFSNSITLLPYKSAILIKTGSSSTSSPTVSITSPSNNAKYTAPAYFDVSAAAADADGTISKVEFYKGTTLIHTEYVYPYKWRWSNVPAGNYTVTAKATDNSGRTATSSGVLIYVVANKAPTVSITSPLNNAKYTAPAYFDVSATAADADGTISKVDFYKGTTLIHTESVYPYKWRWSNVPAGNYTLTAKATDNKGLTAKSASVSISVVTSSLARSATSSADTASKTTVTSTIIATMDSTDAVSKQNFFNDPISLELSPNPARNNLNILASGLQRNKKLIISVFSISGVLLKTMQSSTSNQVLQLDVSSFSSGVYIVRVTCGESVLSKQFVKL